MNQQFLNQRSIRTVFIALMVFPFFFLAVLVSCERSSGRRVSEKFNPDPYHYSGQTQTDKALKTPPAVFTQKETNSFKSLKELFSYVKASNAGTDDFFGHSLSLSAEYK